MKGFEVYDLETLINLFTYTGYNCNTKTWRTFVICDWLNQLPDLVKWLHELKEKDYYMIGFNNENFDYPIVHHILNHEYELLNLSGLAVAQDLYSKAQQLIEDVDFSKKKFNAISDKNKYIKQIDLYKIWNYDNPARATSLKDLEICFQIDNVEEMPIKHNIWCKPGDENLILSYNKNDVYTTYLFFKTTLGISDYSLYAGKNKLQLREQLKNKFNLNCLNYSDIKIGEELILSLYAKKTNQSVKAIKNLGGTKRPSICLKDCIPPWANFKSKEFNKLKSIFESTYIINNERKFSTSLFYHDIKIDYGTGGLHSSAEPGIYSADDYWTILDEDVGSLYPSLAIQLKLYPEHLGPEFFEIYNKDIVSVRLNEKKKPKKERDLVIMEGYKLAANGIVGKSGEETSALFDPLYALRITTAGQMFLSLWTEKLVEKIPEIKFIQHNTDGITYLLPRKDIPKAKAVAEEMTKLTGLYIEDNYYSKFILRDVNNYLAIYENGETKAKGAFEIDKEYHKDPSMRIVPIAVKKYFVEGIPIKETIKNHTDIFDFCLRLKLNSSTTGIFKYFSKEQNDFIKIKLDRTTRYYVSKLPDAGSITKIFNSGQSQGVNIGYSCTIFNKYEKKDISDYNINYDFYISEAYKLKNAVNNGQLSLF